MSCARTRVHGAKEAFLEAAPEDAVADQEEAARVADEAITIRSCSGSRSSRSASFSASSSTADWAAGHVGGRVADGLTALVGRRRLPRPARLRSPSGALMLVRSRLVDVRPFRLGLAVTALGRAPRARGRPRRICGAGDSNRLSAGSSAQRGVLILGRVHASRRDAAPHRRLGRRARSPLPRACEDASRARDAAARRTPARPRSSRYRRRPGPPPPLVDGAHGLPGHHEARVEPPPLVDRRSERAERGDAAIAVRRLRRRPDRLPPSRPAILRKSRAYRRAFRRSECARCRDARAALANFGIDATVVGEIAGPRVTRYELQLAPGTKVSKVAALKDDLSYALATTEIRILAPIPGKQAVGVEVPNVSPEPRHARRHLRRPAADGEPALRLARQGHLRQRGLDRPRADAAPAHRRHDRLGQVRLHQHDPHVDPPAVRRPTRCG